METSDKIVLGLTGPFGSGCSYIAKHILVNKGYEYISLSELLKKEIGNEASSRSELQDKGNELRATKGAGYLAKLVVEAIQNSDKKKFVIDSIRNTHEIEVLKSSFTSFYLFAVWANKDIRWERVKSKYNQNQLLFNSDDKRDKDEKIENGQQITLCYQMADIIILNEQNIPTFEAQSFDALCKTVNKYLEYIEHVKAYEPDEMETLMAMAYANSMRSSCSQRKVGALIIDNYGNIFSSGYNEVPVSQSPCKLEYGKCYRKYLRDEISQKVNETLQDDSLTKKVTDIIKNNSKMLDYCRALHAEESAIINMVRLNATANFAETTIYTTTYPCNLCANKIAQVGIKKLVYYEPYPQDEAKNILQSHNVKQTPFQGVTFNSYFKFMEVLR